MGKCMQNHLWEQKVMNMIIMKSLRLKNNMEEIFFKPENWCFNNCHIYLVLPDKGGGRG
jgi:hypothetical protein